MTDAALAQQPTTAAPTDGKITCQIDGARVHSVQKHINDNYDGEWTLERYKSEFPSAPLLSEAAKAAVLKAKQKKEQEKARAAEVAQQSEAAEDQQQTNKGPRMALIAHTPRTKDTRKFAEVFDLGNAEAAKNTRGGDIPCDVVVGLDRESLSYVPDVDEKYVFPIEITKNILMGLMLNMPILLWGYHGTGKTTALEQYCARTNRPFMRVQHTINTEEAHIVGQYVVQDGSTHFQLGPLAQAMLNGYTYCADEYDFAMPSVLSVYQPVLEGKPLVIKDAPPELRVIRPHPDFRFVATGNTNGGGDETGLYQGTNIQNAANYSRFQIVIEVPYMEEKLETAVIAGQAGISKADAKKLVSFGNKIREQFKGSKLSSTISPRELINAARIAVAKGSDWKEGLQLAFLNRLSRTDKEVCEQLVQRIFG